MRALSPDRRCFDFTFGLLKVLHQDVLNQRTNQAVAYLRVLCFDRDISL